MLKLRLKETTSSPTRYITTTFLKKSVERLGSSSANQRLVDFLILKRAMVIAGSDRITLSLGTESFLEAIREFMACDPPNHPSKLPPFVNIFGTAEHGDKGFRSNKYLSNGTAVTVARWRDVIEIHSEGPRVVSFKPGYIDHLKELLLKAEGKTPILEDVANWYFRHTNLAIPKYSLRPESLAALFVKGLQLSQEEINLLFQRARTVPLEFASVIANAKDYLPQIPLESGNALYLETRSDSSDETLVPDEDGAEHEEKNDGEEIIDQPYDPSRTNIVTRQITIDLLTKRIQNEEIDLATSFQRRGDLWSDTQKSRLIESILIRIPLPSFYFDASNDSKWLVVDGLQRLSTLKLFLREEMPLFNLEFLPEYNQKQFENLPRALRRRIEETQVTVNLIQPGTPDKVKFYIFRRINTGGLVLTPQEIRNALNQGPAVAFLFRMANSTSFLDATTRSISGKRMVDCEFVLRFLAFSLTSYQKYTVPDLDAFLNDQMAQLNKIPNMYPDLERRFDQTMQAARKIFGEHAFRKSSPDSPKRQPANKALFEAWSVCLGNLGEKDLEILIQRKDRVVQLSKDLLKDYTFEQSVTQGTGDVRKVAKRFSSIDALIQTVLAKKAA